MKKALAIVLAMTMLLSMTACGKPAPTTGDSATPGTTPAPATTSLYPGTPGADSVVVNLGSNPPELNTILTTDSISGNVLRHTIVGLTMLDNDNKAVPGVAKDWKISEDGLTYTFNLRNDMKWTNGEPVTAKDFIFAWTQVLTKEVASEYNYMCFAFKNGEAFYNEKAKIEEVGMKAIDDYTLEIVLDHPIPYFLTQLAFYTFAPVNEKAYTDIGADQYGKDVETICSNGAYKVTQWVHEEKIVLTLNEAYPDAANYSVKTIDMRMLKDSNTAMNAFRAGEIDMIGLNGDQRAMLKAEGYPVTSYADGGSWYFEYSTKPKTNAGKPNPISNKKVRQALTLAIDADSFVKDVLKDDSVVGTVNTNPAVIGFDGKPFAETVGTLFVRDAAKAKVLLEEGLKEAGMTMEDMKNISYISDDTDNALLYAAFFQEQWKVNLGVEIKTESMPFASRLDRMQTKDFEIVMAGWSPDYNDPMTYLDLWVTDSGNNHTSWSNAKYDQLLKDATVEADPAKRQEMFVEAEKILADEMPVGMVYYRWRDYVCSEKLSGVNRTAFQNLDFNSIKVTEVAK